jgi:hypothetical protein
MRQRKVRRFPAGPLQTHELPANAGVRLERVGGTLGLDGLERVSSQKLLDLLEIEQRQRTASNYRHLARLMSEQGWTAVRVRDLTRGGYKEQVRGYVRNDRAVS